MNRYYTGAAGVTKFSQVGNNNRMTVKSGNSNLAMSGKLDSQKHFGKEVRRHLVGSGKVQ